MEERLRLDSASSTATARSRDAAMSLCSSRPTDWGAQVRLARALRSDRPTAPPLRCHTRPTATPQQSIDHSSTALAQRTCARTVWSASLMTSGRTEMINFCSGGGQIPSTCERCVACAAAASGDRRGRANLHELGRQVAAVDRIEPAELFARARSHQWYDAEGRAGRATWLTMTLASSSLSRSLARAA
jgi:hypothetical protein